MITIIAAAIITVVVLVMLLMPLMVDTKKRKLGWAILYAVTILSMGIYLWRGAPYIPSQPALFETQGTNFEKRILAKKEKELEETLAAKPDDTRLMLSLGAVYMQTGKLDEAITLLTAAYNKQPEEIIPIRLKLGAAHYAAALAAVMIEDNKPLAKIHFEKAIEIAPDDAGYYERLIRDSVKYQDEGD